MKVEIIRHKEQAAPTVQTLGDGFVLNDNGKAILSFKTMELGWNNNRKRESCIPVGEYEVVKRNSPKYGDHFHIQNVPNRDFILIHAANYSRQLLGCIAPGAAHIDLDKDGLKDVTSSKVTMAELNKLLPNSFKLLIK